MDNELLTLKEIAQQLDVAESNLRYYRDRYPEFIPSVKHKKRIFYQPEAVEVFREIAALVAERKSTTTIRERLNSMFPVNMDVVVESKRNNSTTQQLKTQDVAAQEKANNKALAQANDEIYFLRQVVKTQQEQIQSLTTNILQIQAPRPWYKRLFSRED